MNTILNNVFKFFYPSFCRSCDTLIPQDDIFCFDCKKNIKPIVSIFLPVTKKHTIKVFAASAYIEPLKSLILKKAFSEKLASKQLAQIILENIEFNNIDFDYLIPVPLHWTRYAKRGYNQAQVIAQALSKKLNKPVLDILKRTKRTAFQSSLRVESRKDNVKNVFDIKLFYKKFNPKILENKKILLIDDLYTTGATLKNSSKILLSLNPKSINSVVACRVV